MKTKIIVFMYKFFSAAIKILYIPIYLLGHIIWFLGRILLGIGYFLRLDVRKAKDIFNSIIKRK